MLTLPSCLETVGRKQNTKETYMNTRGTCKLITEGAARLNHEPCCEVTVLTTEPFST